MDTTAPTVTATGTAYYSDAAMTTELTGDQPIGTPIYTKVTFSEPPAHVAGDGAAARPYLIYRFPPPLNETQYDIVAATATLASGDCQPTSAANVYRCLLTAPLVQQNRDYVVKVGTATTDVAGNALAAVYTHDSALKVHAQSTVACGVLPTGDAQVKAFFPAHGARVNPALMSESADDVTTYIVENKGPGVSFGEEVFQNLWTLPSLDRTQSELREVFKLRSKGPHGADITFDGDMVGNRGMTYRLNAKGESIWNSLPEGPVFMGAWDTWRNTAGDTGDPACAIFHVDKTAPTVTAGKSGYFSDAAATTALSGAVPAGADLYTKVTFVEEVTHKAATDSTARPALGYRIDGGTPTRYAVVAASAALASGQCQPAAAAATDVYLCRYTVASGDAGTFDFQVDTDTVDLAGHALAQDYTHAASLTLETTAPTVVSGSTAYYADAAATKAVTGTIPVGADLYTKVTFSEAVRHHAADTTAARPQFSYATGMRYHVVAATAALGTGDCRPQATPPTTVYLCRYTVGSDTDTALTTIGLTADATDVAGNPMASAYTHATTLTVDNPPAFAAGTTVADQAWEQGSAITELSLPTAGGGDGALAYTFVPALPAGVLLVSSASGWSLRGTPTGTLKTTTYTFTASDSDANTSAADTARVMFTISVAADTTGPQVVAADSGYFGAVDLTTALTSTPKLGADVYTKVTFSEDVTHTAGDGAAARPHLSYRIAGVATRYDIVAPSAALASGDCRPAHATRTDVYACRHTVGASDSGSFDFRAGSATTDLSGLGLVSYTHADSVSVDGAAPTVTAASTGYYSDAATTTALSGTVRAGNSIYTKVTFSEDVTHTTGDGAAARPHLSFRVGGTATRYHIVAASATLASGDCKPNHAKRTNVYVCRHDPRFGGGSFDLQVGAATTDLFGNPLAGLYTHAAKLTLDHAKAAVCGVLGTGTVRVKQFLPAHGAFVNPARIPQQTVDGTWPYRGPVVQFTTLINLPGGKTLESADAATVRAVVDLRIGGANGTTVAYHPKGHTRETSPCRRATPFPCGPTCRRARSTSPSATITRGREATTSPRCGGLPPARCSPSTAPRRRWTPTTAATTPTRRPPPRSPAPRSAARRSTSRWSSANRSSTSRPPTAPRAPPSATGSPASPPASPSSTTTTPWPAASASPPPPPSRRSSCAATAWPAVMTAASTSRWAPPPSTAPTTPWRPPTPTRPR